MIRAADIVGLVLAGGRSRRFGWEKAVVVVQGQPMIAGAVAALSPAVGAVAINAPEDSGAAAFARAAGLEAIADPPGLPDGPLSGVLAGLRLARDHGRAWLATTPCDLPFFESRVVTRLAEAGAGARAEDPTGPQPLCALWPVSLESWLAERLARGHPPVHRLQAEAGFATVQFKEPWLFANLNGPPGLEDRRIAWGLDPAGPPVGTLHAWLQPVGFAGAPAMLKVAQTEEERRGGKALAWFGGRGAVRVLRHDAEAVLMDQLADDRPLAALAMRDRAGDLEACAIACAVAKRLHADQPRPPHGLVPLRRWFRDLEETASNSALQTLAWQMADRLLTNDREPRVLHGDLHHGNILHDPAHGWLAIDPKGLLGPRGYDYANLLRNPLDPMAAAPDRLAAVAARVADRAGLPLDEVLGWTLAHAVLSAVWSMSDRQSPDHSLAVARTAASLLDG